jgi:hypothetical protein
MARIGSLGLNRDLDLLMNTACYAHPVKGHEWPGNEEVLYRLDMVRSVQPEETFPFSPRCKDCTRIAKNVFTKRGLTRDQIQRLFRIVGAKWVWASAETDKARKASDKGEVVPDPRNGGLVLDSTVKAREKTAQARLARHDAKLARTPELQAPVVEALAELAEWDKKNGADWIGKCHAQCSPEACTA